MTLGDPRTPVAPGTTVYEQGTAPCSGTGMAWSDDELDTALDGPVSSILFDDEGNTEIAAIFAGPADDFRWERLDGILNDTADVEDWRVGEAIAGAYLEDHRTCLFPWPAGRNRRTSRSSLPGADLVGFGADDAGDCLAFGEVKTSGENRYPPRVMHGSGGLRQQLKALRDREALRHDLFRYLGHHATAAPWLPRFRAAALRYLADTADVQLYGVLVRDVPPDGGDLRTCVQALAADRPPDTRVELLALYLPAGRIDGIGRTASAKRAGGEA